MGFTDKATLCILLILHYTFGIAVASWLVERIGIDLGTSHSSVGVYVNREIEIVPNEQGNIITPSCVAFTDNDILIGEAAKNQSYTNPERTICEVRRLLGRKFDDPEVQRDIEMLPYKIVSRDGKPYIEVKRDGKIVVFSPEEIIAMVLQNMKEMAEAYLGRKVPSAVITAPAYINHGQANAIRDACTIAGIDEPRFLEEPIAALMAYGLHKEVDTNVLVFNFHSTTLDISVLTNDHGICDIAATSHDSRLGGEDFDHRVMNYFVKLIKKKYNKDVSQDKEALRKLLQECERANIALGSQHKVLVEISSLVNGLDISEPFTRMKFEELNMNLLKKMIELTKRALEDAGLGKCDIHEILLVGRGTRIRKVRQLLKDFFYGKGLLDGVNPVEVVAHGAAIECGVLMEDNGFINGGPSLDLTLLSLGIETVGGVMTKVIPRDTIIPTEKSVMLTTYQDRQTSVFIKIYEGERALVKDCRELGSFNLSDIAIAPRGVPEIEVTFHIDGHNRLHVTAEDKSTRNLNSITISNKVLSCGLSPKELLRKIKEAKTFAHEDRMLIKRIEARKILETFFDLTSSINGNDKLTGPVIAGDRKVVKKALEEVMEWLDELNKKMSVWEDLLSPVRVKLGETSSDHHDEL